MTLRELKSFIVNQGMSDDIEILIRVDKTDYLHVLQEEQVSLAHIADILYCTITIQ